MEAVDQKKVIILCQQEGMMGHGFILGSSDAVAVGWAK